MARQRVADRIIEGSGGRDAVLKKCRDDVADIIRLLKNPKCTEKLDSFGLVQMRKSLSSTAGYLKIAAGETL